MAMLYSAARTICDEWLPTTAPNYATIRDRSIKMAVAYAAPRVDEQTFQDFTAKDAVTTRYAITGRNVRPLPEVSQVAPTGLNLSGVAAPTTAPTLAASGSGSTFTAGLWYVGYSYSTALGETQMSTLGTITLTSGQNIVTGVLTLPTHVTGINWYVSTAEYNAVVQQKLANQTGTAKTFTSPASAGTSPLIDYTDLASLQPGAYEPGVDTNGTVLTTVTTLNLGTAPAAGAKFRVRFSRTALPPTNPTDVIGLPDEWMNWVAPWVCALGLALGHQGGDATRFQQVAASLEPLVQDFLAKNTGRQATRVNWTPWSVT
jgi:hypothetical protein